MNKILLGIGALVLGLSFVGEASAAPRRIYPGPARSPYVRKYYGATPYHLRNGVAFRGGYYFAGRGHSHWSHRTWSPVFRRYHYYDPYLRSYYHWCPVTHRYLPVTPALPGFGVGLRAPVLFR